MPPIRISTINFDINGEKEIKTNNVCFVFFPDQPKSVVRCDVMRGSGLCWDGGLAVHHFNVPARLDVLDRFIALHYTDWESLNGRNINNPPARHCTEGNDTSTRTGSH